MEAKDLLDRLLDDLCWDLVNEENRHGPEGIKEVRRLPAAEASVSCATVVTHGGQVFRVDVELFSHL